MSEILYLEPVGGIAGDMFLAAAIDLGVSPKEIESLLSGLSLPAWHLSVRKASRHSLTGTHLVVEIDQKPAPSSHRHLAEIRALIEQTSSLPPRARARALAIFQVIGEAEAKIHQIPLAKVHFHEVGALDSIIDVCGAAAVLELLGNPQVYAAPPPLGSGASRAAHGTLPIPAPATLEILRDLPVRFEGVGELTTPTGAALLKVLCQIAPPPEFLLQRVGYGVGTSDFPDRPNVLRASLGRIQEAVGQATWVVEANLDDCSPQLLAWLLERSLESGAYDAFVSPATMKKGRPGHLVAVVVPEHRKDAIIDLLLAESTTLGVRLHRVERTALDRRHQEVETSFGRVRIKIAERNGLVLNAQPEFEDCRALAERHQVPLKLVQAEALAAYYAQRFAKSAPPQ
jgi:uncharacterized protein (TIGR00299 family) protein